MVGWHLDQRLYVEPTDKYCVLSIDVGGEGSAARSYVVLDVLCPYTAALVDKAFRRRRKRWRVIRDTSKAHLQWGDYECLDWDRIVAGRLRGSSYCTRKGLSRKAQLSMYVNKYLSKAPQSPLKHAMPRTIILDTWEAFDDKMTFNLGGDIASFGDDLGVRQCLSLEERLDWALESVKEAMAAQQLVACEAAGGGGALAWILKASTLNKGAGVHLIAGFDDVRAAVRANHDIREWVLQEYVARPLLARGRKFHLRAYALAVGCVTVYLFDQVLLLAAGAPYTADDLSNPFAHITNTARQIESADFDEGTSVALLSNLPALLSPAQLERLRGCAQQEQGCAQQQQQQQGCVQQQHELDGAQQLQNGQGFGEQLVERLQASMRVLTAELFRAFRGEFAVFAPLPHCFEHFGLDFLVDDNLNVWLLEANPGPDFKQTGARLAPVIEALMEDTSRVCVDGEAGGGVGSAVGGLVKVYDEAWSGARGAPTMKMV